MLCQSPYDLLFSFLYYALDGKKQYRLQVLKQGFDANYDWLSLETEEEEKEYGRNHLVVECILDFVLNCFWLDWWYRIARHTSPSGTEVNGFQTQATTILLRALAGDRMAGNQFGFGTINWAEMPIALLEMFLKASWIIFQLTILHNLLLL